MTSIDERIRILQRNLEAQAGQRRVGQEGGFRSQEVTAADILAGHGSKDWPEAAMSDPGCRPSLTNQSLTTVAASRSSLRAQSQDRAAGRGGAVGQPAPLRRAGVLEPVGGDRAAEPHGPAAGTRSRTGVLPKPSQKGKQMKGVVKHSQRKRKNF